MWLAGNWTFDILLPFNTTLTFRPALNQYLAKKLSPGLQLVSRLLLTIKSRIYPLPYLPSAYPKPLSYINNSLATAVPCSLDGVPTRHKSTSRGGRPPRRLYFSGVVIGPYLRLKHYLMLLGVFKFGLLRTRPTGSS